MERERERDSEPQPPFLSHLSSATFQSISGVRCHPCITTNLFYTTFEISATTLRGATDNTDVNLICCNCFMLILFARCWLSDLLWRRLARHYCLLVGEIEGLKMRNVTICHNPKTRNWWIDEGSLQITFFCKPFFANQSRRTWRLDLQGLDFEDVVASLCEVGACRNWMNLIGIEHGLSWFKEKC